MKLFRVIPVYAAAAALILVPTLAAAQTQPATETVKNKAKTAGKMAKEAADQTSQTAGKSASKVKGKEATEAIGKGTAQPPETPKAGKTKTATTGSAQRAMPGVSESEIAGAKASGKVWVNTETGVYHKGGRWYGTTKQGKFMTEDEAIKAGYRASKSK